MGFGIDKVGSWAHFGLLLLALMVASCNKSTELADLSVSQEEFVGISQDGENLEVIVEAKGEFEATSNVTWLEPNLKLGSSRNIITIKVSPNITGQERTGRVTFSTTEHTASVSVTQQGGEVILDNVEYELKVIFHVLYNEADATNEDEQRRIHVVNSAELQQMLEYVNSHYAGNFLPKTGIDNPDPSAVVRLDSKIRFTLATTDPDGKTISPSGIQKVTIEERNLDPAAVMRDGDGGKYHSMAWPLDEYINVFIFPFTPPATNDEGITVGIAHMPAVVSAHPLEGLSTQDRPVKQFANYNHCIVLNLQTFQERFYSHKLMHGRELAASTLAHELGHYLGLYHPFAEDKTGTVTQAVDECKDTDYCEDTPSYNRIAYWKGVKQLQGTVDNNTPQAIKEGLLQRNDCTGRRFPSTNIMDYEYSYNDRFTAGQIARMRHVLYYSYSVPGEKAIAEKSTRVANESVVHEPRISICTHGHHHSHHH